MSRRGRADLIDRNPQNLPLPLGDLSPRRRSRTRAFPIRFRRTRSSDAAAAVGILLALAAAVVTLTQPPIRVYLQGDTVHVGDLNLSHPTDNGGLKDGVLYTGPATLLLVPRPDGSIIASSVTFLGGARSTGVCDFGPPTRHEISEHCVLRIGVESVTCNDVLRFDAPGSWQRRCSDGQSLAVSVPAGADVIPMPFPLGR